ncbi:hypothetical protein Droror1_Dr00025627 [Drosera rotundifolia]
MEAKLTVPGYTEGGALWDIFKRQDVSLLQEYLKKHYGEFRHINCDLLKQVVHPVLDQTLYLTKPHKRHLKIGTKGAGRLAGLKVLRIVNEPTAYGFEEKDNETIMVFDPGGDDFHKRIVYFLAADFKRDEGVDLLKDKYDDLDLRTDPSQEEGDDAMPVDS